MRAESTDRAGDRMREALLGPLTPREVWGALQWILSQGDGGAAHQPKVTLLLSVHRGSEPRQSIIRIQVSTHRAWLHQTLDLLTPEPGFLAVIMLRQHAFAPFSFLHLPLLCTHPKVLFILLWGRSVPGTFRVTPFSLPKRLKMLAPSPFQRDHCKQNSQQNLRPSHPPLHDKLLH